jgi:DNA (cytosine-5)-methyltransferase 1
MVADWVGGTAGHVRSGAGGVKFGSVCSGIEAASVAWPFWKAAWFSEIEPFPCAVLAHHYPDVPNLGDMTTLPDRILSGEVEAPDVFCGGTPCQAFSVAGNRRSLDDARGNLSLTFCEIANAIDTVRHTAGKQPAVIFWENVPGVLNTKDNAFGCFLAGLAGETVPLEPPGGRWTDAGCVFGPQRAVAWRVLDAQYFGLAQRRRRVFAVASARNGFNPAEVLFEQGGERRDTAPSRETRQGLAGDAEGGAKWPADLASTLNAAFGSKQGLEDQHINGGAPLFVPHIAPTVTNGPPFSRTGNERVECDALVATNMTVRRLTPTECERLQGFPDGYTNIPWRNKPEAPDGPRYKALGNSWAVPVVRWIGERINEALK